MFSYLLIWLLNAVALLGVAYILPGISVASFGSALIAALILGLLNTFVQPVLFWLTIPISLLTVGLFVLVLNGLLFWFAGSMIKGFRVDGFWWGVAGAVVYSLISWLLSKIVS